jgi:DNA-binding transcriptional ArsR family regulator
MAQPQAAGDLAKLSQLALASVSEHLKVLRKTGLLRLEKRGRFWFYQTDRAALGKLAMAVSALERNRPASVPTNLQARRK